MSRRVARWAAACAAVVVAGDVRPSTTLRYAPGGRVPAEPARVLRFCGDPNNLPFSNARGEGLENRLAAIVAAELGARATWVFHPQRRGFFRRTLLAGACDVVAGVPVGLDLVLATRPYYRSSYVLVWRRDRALALAGLDDPKLRALRIGVQIVGNDHVSTPPAHALARLGLEDHVVPYTVYGDYAEADPPARVVEAVARGEVDVAAVWGPLAGWYARRSPVALELRPIRGRDGDGPAFRYEFAIAMGVRRSERALRDALDAALERRRADVERLLDAYGVPRS